MSQALSAPALDQETLDRLRAFVGRHGLSGASRLLGVDRGGIARALGHLGIRRGTATLIRLGLDADAQEIRQAS